MPLKLNNRCNKINKVIDLIQGMNNNIILTTCPNKRLSFLWSTLRQAAQEVTSDIKKRDKYRYGDSQSDIRDEEIPILQRLL